MTPEILDREIEQLREIVRAAPSASSAAAGRTMVGNRRRDSRPERRLRSALHADGLRFRVDLPIRLDGRRPIRPDIVFTRLRVAVFVDGCFWHGCSEHAKPPRTNSSYWAAKIALNQKRDEDQRAALEAVGWNVVRVWEHDETPSAVAAVRASLRSQAASDSDSDAGVSASRTTFATA